MLCRCKVAGVVVVAAPFAVAAVVILLTDVTLNFSYVVQIAIKRKTGNIFWNIVMPLLTLVLLGVTPFGVSQSELPDRIGTLWRIVPLATLCRHNILPIDYCDNGRIVVTHRVCHHRFQVLHGLNHA